jgi:hypothetical protein
MSVIDFGPDFTDSSPWIDDAVRSMYTTFKRHAGLGFTARDATLTSTQMLEALAQWRTFDSVQQEYMSYKQTKHMAYSVRDGMLTAVQMLRFLAMWKFSHMSTR